MFAEHVRKYHPYFRRAIFEMDEFASRNLFAIALDWKLTGFGKTTFFLCVD
jgi:hypothetical protein